MRGVTRAERKEGKDQEANLALSLLEPAPLQPHPTAPLAGGVKTQRKNEGRTGALTAATLIGMRSKRREDIAQMMVARQLLSASPTLTTIDRRFTTARLEIVALSVLSTVAIELAKVIGNERNVVATIETITTRRTTRRITRRIERSIIITTIIIADLIND